MTDKKKDIRAAVDARRKAEEAALDDNKKDSAVTPGFVRDCFDANRLGDGTLFAALNRGRYLNNLTAKDGWHRWTGHYWTADVMNGRYSGVEMVVEKYEEEKERVEKARRKALSKKDTALAQILLKRSNAVRARIKSLRDDGADKCLLWSTRIENGLGIRGEEFDRDPWLLPCRNGVLELHTGRFRDGRPSDLLTRAVPHNWEGFETPAPAWERFLSEVFDGDESLVAYIRRLFGYGITGLSSEHILPILLGEGRNGKSTFVETLRFVLGDLAKPIQSEMLLDQKFTRSPSGPSPEIMTLKGLRVAFASETDEGKRFSASRAKWLSSSDTLTGRSPHDRTETTFSPTHLLCLLTNHLPHAHGDDYAFWHRLRIIPFNLRFVDNPSAPNERPCVKDLPERLKKEAPGVLAWLVRGCIEWQREGLRPPAKVFAATEEARLNEDIIAGFVEASCVEDPDERLQFSTAYNAFTSWYEEFHGDRWQPRKKRFGQLMEKRFKKEKKGGIYYFYGLRLKTEWENIDEQP